MEKCVLKRANVQLGEQPSKLPYATLSWSKQRSVATRGSAPLAKAAKGDAADCPSACGGRRSPAPGACCGVGRRSRNDACRRLRSRSLPRQTDPFSTTRLHHTSTRESVCIDMQHATHAQAGAETASR